MIALTFLQVKLNSKKAPKKCLLPNRLPTHTARDKAMFYRTSRDCSVLVVTFWLNLWWLSCAEDSVVLFVDSRARQMLMYTFRFPWDALTMLLLRLARCNMLLCLHICYFLAPVCNNSSDVPVVRYTCTIFIVSLTFDRYHLVYIL